MFTKIIIKTQKKLTNQQITIKNGEINLKKNLWKIKVLK